MRTAILHCLPVLLLACLCQDALTLPSSESWSHPLGPSGQDLRALWQLNNRLYNQRVTRVRIVQRPVDGILGKLGVPHRGVEVVTEDGGRWLIHKGPNFGTKRDGETVVVSASQMSHRWKPVTDWRTSELRVGDLVKISGPKYNVIFDNCNTAAKAMYNGRCPL